MAVDPGVAAELIRGLMAGRGLTQRAVAAELGVSDRMVRKVLGGESAGGNYVPRLQALVKTGRASGVPVELRPMRVRAPRSAGVKSVPRQSPAPAPKAARGRYGATEREYLPGGGSVQTITAPKSDGVGREQARAAILQSVGAAGRDAHVAFILRDSNGNTRKLGSKGGYRASRAIQGMRGEGDDPFEWLELESDGAGGYGDFEASGIVAVTVMVL